jgi:HD superfamily phosphodiesterase
MKILSTLLRFVQLTSTKNNIDESHSLGHSMEVLHNANHIFMNNMFKYPEIKDQETIIYTSAIIHDMCDKKYMNQTEGIKQINDLLQYKMNYHDIDIIKQIISTMSYSTVKKNGYPNLGKYQMAYHIVREADLLTAYDFDRSVIYHMHKTDGDFLKAYENALNLFENRVLRHHKDELFITEYSKKKGLELHDKALFQIQSWKKIIDSYDCNYIL